MSDSEAQRAALDGVDPTRLLPGEDLSSFDPGDAGHWVGIYDQLLTTKGELLELLRTRMGEIDGVATAEFAATDEISLAAQAARFMERKAFWEERAASST